jgi:hypothetical protein
MVEAQDDHADDVHLSIHSDEACSVCSDGQGSVVRERAVDGVAAIGVPFTVQQFGARLEMDHPLLLQPADWGGEGRSAVSLFDMMTEYSVEMGGIAPLAVPLLQDEGGEAVPLPDGGAEVGEAMLNPIPRFIEHARVISGSATPARHTHGGE